MNNTDILRFILARGFDHLSAIATAIKKIDEEPEDTPSKRQRLSSLTMTFGAINDILHPSYSSIKDIFPEHELLEFIKNLEASHEDAVKQTLFPPCQCPNCRQPEVLDATLVENK
jgi:hypothetical protein